APNHVDNSASGADNTNPFSAPPSAAPAEKETGALPAVKRLLDIRPQVEHTLETGGKASRFLGGIAGGLLGLPGGPAGVVGGAAAGQAVQEALTAAAHYGAKGIAAAANKLGVNPTTPAGHKFIEEG